MTAQELMVFLPPEILGIIVNALAYRRNLRAYGRDPETHSALVQLCIASQALRAFASPHLYSIIIISTQKQLGCLVASLRSPSDLKSIESLSLRDFNSSTNKKNFAELIALIELLQYHASFRQLLVDRKHTASWMYESRSSQDENERRWLRLRAAIVALANLQELHSVQDDMSIRLGRWILQGTEKWEDVWDHTLNIRSLTLCKACFDAKFLTILANHPHIRHVILIHPTINLSMPSSAWQLLQTGTQIVFVGGAQSLRFRYAAGEPVPSRQQFARVAEKLNVGDGTLLNRLAVRNLLENGNFDLTEGSSI